MYDELDIFDKECSNDQFRFECMIECMCMDAEMMSDYTTESEGIGTKIMNKVKEIFEKISNAVKAAITKISNFFTSKKLKAKYEQLLAEAKEAEKQLKVARDYNSEEVTKILDRCTIESYNLAQQMNDVKRISDYVIAGAKNLAAKIKGGEKVTSDDIAKIRQEAKDKWDATSKTDDNAKREYVKIKRVADIVSALSASGVCGVLVSAISKFAGLSVKDSICIGATAGALGGIIEGITHSMNHPFGKMLDEMRTDGKQKAMEANQHYKNASQLTETAVAAQTAALASLTTVVQEAEMMSYRKGVKYLSANLTAIGQALNEIQQLADVQNSEVSKGHMDFQAAKGIRGVAQ